MAPSRISLTLLKGLLTSCGWKQGIGVVASRFGGDYKFVKP